MEAAGILAAFPEAAASPTGRTQIPRALTLLPLWEATFYSLVKFFHLNFTVSLPGGSFTQIVYLLALNFSFTFHNTASDNSHSWLYFDIFIFLGALPAVLYQKTPEPIFLVYLHFPPLYGSRGFRTSELGVSSQPTSDGLLFPASSLGQNQESESLGLAGGPLS